MSAYPALTTYSIVYKVCIDANGFECVIYDRKGGALQKSIISILCVFAVIWGDCYAISKGFPQDPDLKVIVLQGEGAKTDVQKKVDVRIVVQVQDVNTGPISNGQVIFSAPATGPGALFANGRTSITVTTNDQGLAEATLRPNDAVGNYKIRVDATFQARKTDTTIGISNVGIAKPSGGGSGKVIGIVAALAAGGAVAAFAGKGKGGTSTPPPTPTPPPPGPTIVRATAGVPTVGPPG